MCIFKFKTINAMRTKKRGGGLTEPHQYGAGDAPFFLTE